MLFLIFPFDELLELGGGGGQFTISKLMAILTTIGYALRTSGGRYSLLPTEKVGKAAAILATIILLSIIWAESPLASLLRGVSPILLAVLVCYGTQLIDTQERWETVLTALILSGLFAAGMMILGVGSVKVLGGSQERVFLGAEVNPNHTAVIMTVSAYMCFTLLFSGQSTANASRGDRCVAVPGDRRPFDEVACLHHRISFRAMHGNTLGASPEPRCQADLGRSHHRSGLWDLLFRGRDRRD